MITTDLYWNYPKDGVPNLHLEGNNLDGGLAPDVGSIPLLTKLWKFGMDRVYLPFYKKLMVNDKQRYEDAVTVIVEEWEAETLIPCHGDIIRGREKIRQELARHFKID